MSSRMAIVVLNWNDSEQTSQCLKMLSQWRQIDPAIFVVDNASLVPYQLPQFCSQMTTLISSGVNLGYAGGNNLGIKAAMEIPSDLVLLLNSDLQVEERVGLAMQQMMADHQRLGAVGPALEERQEIHLGGRDIGLHQNTRILGPKNDDSSNDNDLAYIPGTMILIRRSVFHKIGYLDEHFFFSGEIADFCKRMTEDGEEILVAENLRARHKKDVEKFDNKLAAYYNLRNRFLYINKHHPDIENKLRWKWIFIGLRQMLGALVRGKMELSKSIFYALVDGWQGKFGNMNHRFITTH